MEETIMEKTMKNRGKDPNDKTVKDDKKKEGDSTVTVRCTGKLMGDM